MVFTGYFMLCPAEAYKPSPPPIPSLLTVWDPFPPEAASASKHLTPHLSPQGKKKPVSLSQRPAIRTHRPQGIVTSVLGQSYLNGGGKEANALCHCQPVWGLLPPHPARCHQGGRCPPDPPCIHTQVPAEGGGQ